MRASTALTAVWLLATSPYHNLVYAITLDITDTASIKSAASTAAYGMMIYYGGNATGATPGILGGEYYWWEAGGMFGALVDYWYYTGDTTYNDETETALVFQSGSNYDYLPANQTVDEGNDDQAFWGMSALEAAETNFQNPPSTEPQWLALGQAVFNTMSARWDPTTCDGGLRWQIYTFNAGYTYKNSISNGALFSIGARLFAYTHNTTYQTWADREWDWLTSVGLVDNSSYAVYDGTSDVTNCSTIDHVQWSYNQGVMIHGAAFMYNHTNGSVQATWATRLSGLLNASTIFFKDDIMYEQACEPTNVCDTDQLTFKAYFSRWLAATTKLAPFTSTTIMPWLRASAAAAAAQCTGGTTGIVCGGHWTTGSYDNTYGVGQQMSALQAIQSLLIADAPELVTNGTGGTSVGNVNAGSTSVDSTSELDAVTVTTAGRVGAGFLTVFVLVGACGIGWFMVA